MLDPATQYGKDRKFLKSHGVYKRFFKAGEHALGMGVDFTHWMDPMRWPDKWVHGIDRYEKSVASQMHAY